MSRWGRPTKNKRRRDPRYFLNEGWVEDHHGGDPSAARLSTGQVMAMQSAGLQYSDLYDLILDASDQGGSNPKAVALLELPEFQEDHRVTSLGY